VLHRRVKKYTLVVKVDNNDYGDVQVNLMSSAVSVLLFKMTSYSTCKKITLFSQHNEIHVVVGL